VQAVSDAWEREFRIRFVIGDVVPWTSGEALPPERLLAKLRGDVPPGEELLVGFSNQRCVGLKRGWAEPFGRRAVVMAGCPSGSLEVVSAEQSLSHELAHLFGMFHPAYGVRSVMRGYAHDVFDPQMIRVIRLMRGYDFRLGVGTLDEPTRRQWTAIWAEGHVPDEASDLAKAVHNLGVETLRRNDMDGAVARFHEAIAIDKSYASPHAMLGMLLSHQGKLDAAAAELRTAKALDFRQIEARTELGYVLLRQGRYDDALWEFRDTLAIDRRHGRAHLGLAFALFGAQKYREAWEQVVQMRALGLTVPAAFVDGLREKMPEPAR
jgi:hypothetical protein